MHKSFQKILIEKLQTWANAEISACNQRESETHNNVLGKIKQTNLLLFSKQPATDESLKHLLLQKLLFDKWQTSAKAKSWRVTQTTTWPCCTWAQTVPTIESLEFNYLNFNVNPCSII
jgi:hypothetical protein